jgi:hypothetical protein
MEGFVTKQEEKLYRALQKLIENCITGTGLPKKPTAKQLRTAGDVLTKYEKYSNKVLVTKVKTDAPTKWQLANKFLKTQLNKKGYEKELEKFMKKHNFNQDDADCFCLMIREAMGLYDILPRFTFKSNPTSK